MEALIRQLRPGLVARAADHALENEGSHLLQFK